MGKLVHRLAEHGLANVRADPEDARGKRVTIAQTGIATRHALGGDSFDHLLPALRQRRDWLDTHR
jgi:hypothetical protein